MSSPAREVIHPSHPVTSPKRRAPLAQAPDQRPTRAPSTNRPRPASASLSSRRRRRRRGGFHAAFWILSAAVVTGMLVARASVSALLVQTSFRIDELESTIASDGDAHEVLTERVASRSSPSKIAAWARYRGMVMPEDVVVVQVPGAAPSSRSDS
jgi:cell division protein FtsL